MTWKGQLTGQRVCAGVRVVFPPCGPRPNAPDEKFLYPDIKTLCRYSKTDQAELKFMSKMLLDGLLALREETGKGIGKPHGLFARGNLNTL